MTKRSTCLTCRSVLRAYGVELVRGRRASVDLYCVLAGVVRLDELVLLKCLRKITRPMSMLETDASATTRMRLKSMRRSNVCAYSRDRVHCCGVVDPQTQSRRQRVGSPMCCAWSRSALLSEAALLLALCRESWIDEELGLFESIHTYTDASRSDIAQSHIHAQAKTTVNAALAVPMRGTSYCRLITSALLCCFVCAASVMRTSYLLPPLTCAASWFWRNRVARSNCSSNA